MSNKGKKVKVHYTGTLDLSLIHISEPTRRS